MISKPRARCRKRECKERAEYGIQTPIHCEQHKDDNDINLIEKKCVKCERIDILNKEGLCVNFCVPISIDNIYRKRQRLKERRVLDLLKKELGPPYIYDKIIPNECKDRTRPDIVYIFRDENKCPSLYIIVEVDENQHKSYCERGEYKKMKETFTTIMGENIDARVLYIRYNPDNYRDSQNRQMKTPQTTREETLVRWIKYLPNNFPKEKLSVLFLFYDGYEESHRTIHPLDPYDLYSYECEICDKEFFSESQLLTHETTHKDCPTMIIEEDKKKILFSPETEIVLTNQPYRPEISA